jgi:exodeoxyribonuclease-3
MPELLRLATWNVNSIRTRLDRVVDWLDRAEVDVLAMQETKCSDTQFPALPLIERGYEVAHVGFNQWNGVAIASRVGLEDVQVGFDGQPTWSGKPDVAAASEARAVGATCGGVRVWSLYVPNGRSLDDPHYSYKLDWLAALRNTAEGWLRADPSAPIALVGDWNIAPTDEDVWSTEFYQGCTHVSEPERQAFNAIVAAQFTDVVRPFTPGPGCTRTGTTPSCASRRGRECGSTSSWARRRWLPGWWTRRSSGRSAKAKRPATMHRSWWTCVAPENLWSCRR